MRSNFGILWVLLMLFFPVLIHRFAPPEKSFHHQNNEN